VVNNIFTPPGECPVCGENVPRNAQACPGCGADARTGWNEEDTRYDGLDLPDAAYGDEPAPRRSRDTLVFVITIIVLLAVITMFVIS